MIDRDSPEFASRIEEYTDQLRTIIDVHGHAVQHVFGDDTGPQFSYTVGLTATGHSELITYGLPPKGVQGILNAAADKYRGDGGGYHAGQVIYELIGNGYDPVLIDVHDVSPLGFARRIYGPQVRAFQLVFPDDEHRWPWQDGSEFVVPLLGPVPQIIE